MVTLKWRYKGGVSNKVAGECLLSASLFSLCAQAISGTMERE